MAAEASLSIAKPARLMKFVFEDRYKLLTVLNAGLVGGKPGIVCQLQEGQEPGTDDTRCRCGLR